MDDSPRPRATGWRAHTPNALTIARLLLTAIFVVVLVGAEPGGTAWSPGLLAAVGLFVLAALTDKADGTLARRWNAVSRFGRVVDPFADKILILSAFIMLAGPTLGLHSGVETWMVVLILARELLVTTIRGVYESEGVDFSASWTGKIKMVVQSIAAPVALLDAASPKGEAIGPRPATVVLLWVTVAMTLWSAVPYVVRAYRARRELAEASSGEGA
ncbi:MAG: CDP-diacylglycerol--glycerol-3-phosphate 3-phosphatidyltransferase [Phycisphaeraceae bacterium]|nr:MAG: CDP-diacylglycerol--glycerol-3-phosphate 3-phosphatidyltransferase [Phycisphaeraceae bacterium]